MHRIFVNFPDADRVMSHSLGALDATPVVYTLVTRVFGGNDSPEFRKKLAFSRAALGTPVERLFVNEANATASLERARIHEEAASFVTFSSDHNRRKPWENSSDMKAIASELPGKVTKVEANFQSLVRDFGAHIAIPLMYGTHFLKRYPQAIDDLWKFDNDLFPLLMIGIPEWAPFKIVREGVAARTRIIRELEGLYRRIDQYQHGKPIDFNDDMSDVSDAPLGRNKIFERDGWSFHERGVAEIGTFWGQNANTQPMLFWLLTYAYSTPGIIEQIREETAQYIGLSQSTPKEMTSLDIPGLTRNCQFLKACLFETYRLANEPSSIRYVNRPMTINDGDLKHDLKAGSFLTVPFSVGSLDASIYPDPDKFDPSRFVGLDEESGKMIARYGQLRPWGSGPGMCKGRTFAEKELMSLGAAIIALWDVEPASGTWELPAKLPGTGVKKPVKDIRVLISRRKW